MSRGVTAVDLARALGQHPPTPEQVAVIEAPIEPVLVVAGAGSGKTETMAARVLWLVANGHVAPELIADVIGRLLSSGGNFIRNGSGALMLAYVAAGRLVGYYEPYMHAWDCLAGYCLVKEAGGWYHPFPVAGDQLTKGAPVVAAGPGARADLEKLAGLA